MAVSYTNVRETSTGMNMEIRVCIKTIEMWETPNIVNFTVRRQCH